MFNLVSRPLRQVSRLTFQLGASFGFPKHDLLGMPALSPTMKEGKILKWLIKEGDQVQPGDAIAEIETDKATMTFEVQEKGYIAKMNPSQDFISIGDGVVVLAKKADEVSQFSNFDFSAPAQSGSAPSAPPTSTPSASSGSTSEAPAVGKTYPSHTFLQMPAVSPTMTQGKILKWKINPGDSFNVGDALFSIETDKATVDYEATEKGVLAKVIAKSDQSLPIGQNVAIVVKKKESVSAFQDFTEGAQQTQTSSAPKTASSPTPVTEAPKTTIPVDKSVSAPPPSGRVVASPLARSIAKQLGLDLSQIQGSGPSNRIIKQDVDAFISRAKQAQVAVAEPVVVAAKPSPSPVSVSKQQAQVKKPSAKVVVADNPYEQIALTSMRKTIANRLQQSKQTIPHYYVSLSVEMDAITALRNELNLNQKQNGTKISVNDIIIKAMALALRDYPNVNVQWHGNTIRKFRYADISVAVAVEGGLITPIVSRADTLGLLDISRKTKDLAKRAREGKLDPSEYIGGTSTISNLGMFGINTVTSIINPPQATILGVGKTEKRILPSNEPQGFRTAQVMDLIASCDHRAVDGALTAQWVTRIKDYLQHPTRMLL